MAEAIVILGVVSSVVALASEGLKLCRTLDLYRESVKYSDKEAHGIARDIKDTAVVLEQLGANMKLEEEILICKPEFYRAAKQNVQECAAIFQEVEDTLYKSAEPVRDDSDEVITFEVKGRGRLKWPLKQGRMVLLRSDLARLKSSLHLMTTVMMHARELQEKAVLDRERSIGVQIDALKIQTLELETEAAENRYKTLRRRADQVKDHWKGQTLEEEYFAEKAAPQDPGQSDPSSNPFHVMESSRRPGPYQDGRNPKVTLTDFKTNDTVTTGNSDVLMNRDEDSRLKDFEKLDNDSSQEIKGTLSTSDWPKLEILLQRIASAQETLALPHTYSNSQSSRDLKADHQKYQSSKSALSSSNKLSSTRLENASMMGKDFSIGDSRSEVTNRNDGAWSPVSERAYETEATGQSQATSELRSKSIRSRPESVLLSHDERRLGFLDPYSPGPTSSPDEDHHPSEINVKRPRRMETLLNKPQGLQQLGPDVLSPSSDDLANHNAKTIIAQDSRLTKSDDGRKNSCCSFDQGSYDEGKLSVPHQVQLVRSLRPRSENINDGKSIPSVKESEAEVYQPISNFIPKDIKEGVEADEPKMSQDASRPSDAHTFHDLPQDIQDPSSELIGSEAPESELSMAIRSKAILASEDVEKYSMEETRDENSNPNVSIGRLRRIARRLKSIPSRLPARGRPSSFGKATTTSQKTSTLPLRELEGVGKAQSQAGPSTTLPQAPAETPLTSSSPRPQSPMPMHINHDTQTFNNEPMTQNYNSTGFFPPDPTAVSHQNWSICDLRDPRTLVYSNGWRPNYGHDFLPQLTAWVLQRLPSNPDQATRSWFRVNRMMMHIDIEEIRHIIRKQKKRRKSVLATLAELSSYQQLQITRLLEDLQEFDYPKGATWTFTLQALLTQPKGKTGKEIKSIQVFIERRLQPGTMPSHMGAELPNGYPSKHSTAPYNENTHISSSAFPPQQPPFSYSRIAPYFQPEEHSHQHYQSNNSYPSTNTEVHHHMPSTSHRTDSERIIISDAADVGARSRKEKKEKSKREPRHRSGKESTVRFAPSPSPERRHSSSRWDSNPGTSSYSERWTEKSDRYDSGSDSSLASIQDEIDYWTLRRRKRELEQERNRALRAGEHREGTRSLVRGDGSSQKRHKKYEIYDTLTPAQRQIVPVSLYEAPKAGTPQQQYHNAEQPPMIVDNLLSKWTFLDIDQKGALQLANHVSDPTDASTGGNAKRLAAIKKEVQRRRQFDRGPELPRIDDMD